MVRGVNSLAMMPVAVLDYFGRERFVLSASLGTICPPSMALFSSVAERVGRMWLAAPGQIFTVHNAKVRNLLPLHHILSTTCRKVPERKELAQSVACTHTCGWENEDLD